MGFPSREISKQRLEEHLLEMLRDDFPACGEVGLGSHSHSRSSVNSSKTEPGIKRPERARADTDEQAEAKPDGRTVGDASTSACSDPGPQNAWGPLKCLWEVTEELFQTGCIWQTFTLAEANFREL